MLKKTLLSTFLVLSSVGLPFVTVAESSYTVGIVPQFDSRKIQKIWQPILEKLTQKTGLNLKLEGSASIPEFEKAFTEGKYDFAYMNPYHLIVANQKQGYKPMVRDVARKLYGIIVVKKDSPIQSIEELDGKIVAMPAPNALGAALIPRTEFATKYKIKPEYKYVKSHSSVYLNVLLGQTVAGGGVQKTLLKQKPGIKKNLRVLHETTHVSPHPLAFHPRVSKADVTKVQEAFLAMGASVEDSLLLNNIPMKKAGKASMQDYEPLRSMGLEAFYID